MSIIVMVDSGASLSKAMLKKCDIALLPYNVMFKNGDCYKDVIDIKNQKELVNLIEAHNDLPKIDQVSSDDIKEYFRKYIDNGDDILYISVSSKLSHAYNEVLEASKSFDENTIEIIDSLNVGTGEALLAMYAKDYVNKGHGLKQTAKYLNRIKHSIKSCYAVGNASYLHNQRRCKAIYDNYLEFYHRVPIAEIEEGKIVLTLSAKENKLALQVLKNIVLDYCKDRLDDYLLIAYSGDRTYALKLKNYAHKLLKDVKIDIVEDSSVVYINTGVNTLSLAFLIDK